VTPALGQYDYVFPVVGNVLWGDSYGVPRPDTPSGWHHGDDLFASLGAPTVAVADGWVSGVGWEKLGGWRLWLHDGAGNAFYYAHLSGYTPVALHGAHVKAGQVLGYVGHTGDAITTPYHLHFEVHPASLLYMGEDGAVDPTSYLQHWRHLEHVQLPRPVLPSLPSGALGDQAASSLRDLLAVLPVERKPSHRAKIRPHRPSVPLEKRLVRRPPVREAYAPSVAAPYTPAATGPAPKTAGLSRLEIAGVTVGGLAAVIGIAALASILLLRRSGSSSPG
jgi:hypothetical protein